MFVTNGPHNQTGYSNPKYDEIVQKGKGELLTKTKERWDSLLKAEKMLLEDAAIAPLYQRGDAIVQRPKVKVLFTIQLVETTAINGHILQRISKMRAYNTPLFYALFFRPRIYKIKRENPMKRNTYIDFLAYYGIGSAHPGGFTLTKQLLAQLPFKYGANVLEIGCGRGKQRHI